MPLQKDRVGIQLSATCAVLSYTGRFTDDRNSYYINLYLGKIFNPDSTIPHRRYYGDSDSEPVDTDYSIT